MLPARDRDIIQKWFIEHENLKREMERGKSTRIHIAFAIYLLGAALVAWLFNHKGVLETTVLGALIVAVLAYLDQRDTLREKSDRLHESEKRFREFGLSVTHDGRLKTAAGECDPLYTEAYDPDLPPLKSTKT